MSPTKSKRRRRALLGPSGLEALEDVPRSAAVARVLPSGQVIVAAGSSQASLERYDPVADTWTLLPSLITPRYVYGIAVLPGGALLAAGGWNSPSGAAALPNTEIYFPPVSP